MGSMDSPGRVVLRTSRSHLFRYNKESHLLILETRRPSRWRCSNISRPYRCFRVVILNEWKDYSCRSRVFKISSIQSWRLWDHPSLSHCHSSNNSMASSHSNITPTPSTRLHIQVGLTLDPRGNSQMCPRLIVQLRKSSWRLCSLGRGSHISWSYVVHWLMSSTRIETSNFPSNSWINITSLF